VSSNVRKRVLYDYFKITKCDLLSPNVTKIFLYADNLESHRCDLVCPRLKKRMYFPCAKVYMRIKDGSG